MSLTELDNPCWSALSSIHRSLALGAGEALRYPADRAPFVGVMSSKAPSADALCELVAPGETVVLLGVIPRVPPGWSLERFRPLAQMVCTREIPIRTGPSCIALDEAHRADVLALTALVYPHYFRPRTMDLGDYFGIYQNDRLAAIIGERLGTDHGREMSAICTHPDFRGRGYASRLTAMLTNRTLARGHTPFLHVSFENPRALGLYQQLGYVLRREIEFASLRAPQPRV